MFAKITTCLMLLAGMSIITFLLYGRDKRQARLQRWRTPEKTLQGLALLGGWPGAIFAQQYFKHKNRKVSFQITFWLMVATNVLLTGLWLAGYDLSFLLN